MERLPEAVLALLRPQVSINTLLVDAYAESSRSTLLQALLLDPTCHSYRQAVHLIDRMFELQAEHTTRYGVGGMRSILVTGAGGQIGSDLIPALRERYGEGAVLATDIRTPKGAFIHGGPFEIVDATDQRAVGQAAMRHNADTIYHLAAILSAAGERDPRLTYTVKHGYAAVGSSR